MAVGGAEASAERMDPAFGTIDPWNLLWVMPAKGTRCHHTLTFSPRLFFRLSRRMEGKVRLHGCSLLEGFGLLATGAGRMHPGFSWGLSVNLGKPKEGSPHEEE